MSDLLKFIWIDDDMKRKEEATNMEERIPVKVEFIDVKGVVILKELASILKRQQPDLILMDHKLSDVDRNGFKTGSTAAEVIREQWPDCPIVCITGVQLRDISSHIQSIYEDVFEIERISSYDSTLLSIAQSFQTLKNNRPQNKGDLLKLIEVPEEDRDRFLSALPSELLKKDSYEDKSLILSISQWIRHFLMKRPGFLYDRLWTATILGLKEESFKKVEDVFADAKYDGIFADIGNERWWQSKVLAKLFSNFPDEDSIYPWKVGRMLDGINETDFSKCHATGEDFPETVAYTDETLRKRAPMRLRYTVSHPGFQKSLFFEEIRMMEPPK